MNVSQYILLGCNWALKDMNYDYASLLMLANRNDCIGEHVIIVAKMDVEYLYIFCSRTTSKLSTIFVDHLLSPSPTRIPFSQLPNLCLDCPKLASLMLKSTARQTKLTLFDAKRMWNISLVNLYLGMSLFALPLLDKRIPDMVRHPVIVFAVKNKEL